MDAYQQSPHHRYMRPPQPPPPDPHHYYQQQPPPPPPPPGPLPPPPPPGGNNNSWYPNQFHYGPPGQPPPPPPSSHHSPSPPPTQWAPHPPPQHHQPQPYPAHPPPRPQIAQAYPNQEWGNQSWNHQQSWDYSAPSNSEDWAARAREWAAAKTAMADQSSQPQFVPPAIPEGQSQFHDQYQQPSGAHYPSGYQQYPPAPPQPPQMVFSQENASFGSGQASYVADRHLPYTARDGSFPVDSNNGFSSQETLPGGSSTHQLEVPSSYSSVTGKEENAEKEMYTSLPFSTSSAQGGQYPPADPSNQPLDFTPRFNHDPHMQSSYAPHHDPRGIDPVAGLPSVNSWNPSAATKMYPPVPLGPQHDASMGMPPFGNFPGSSFQPTVPSAGTPFVLGAISAVHHTATFPVDTYGIFSERQKKAAMPNWLKEEIIKNKAIISKSSLEHPKEEIHSVEGDGFDRSIGKEEPVDSRSADSPKSPEEDDDDEDYVEAARTAAINQEIKRVLTKVLLKVTDGLFDEIATRVLREDDMVVEDHNPISSNTAASTSLPPMSVSMASAKVLVPTKGKESESGGNSSSSLPGDVLGLGNYASDEEDDGGGTEIQSSRLPNSQDALQQSRIDKVSEYVLGAIENGHSQEEHEKNDKGLANLERDENRGDNISVTVKMPNGKNDQGSNDTSAQRIIVKSELPVEKVSVKSAVEGSQGYETKVTDKHDQYESGRSTAKKLVKEEDENEKEDENRQRKDEKHSKKEKTDDRSGSKDRINESESRKRANDCEFKEDRKDREKHHRASKEGSDRKRERTKDKEEEKSRHKLTRDSSRHKNNKENSVSRTNDSSDEVSDDSKRKRHSRKRNLSPSPVRSRRRQVSRSPHSKHSQRRHSPYSSLETSRRRRSRSRSSPARRHR